MKHYNFIKTTIIVSLLSSLAQANSDGFYIGTQSSIINMGQDSMKVENKDKSKTTYHDIDGSYHLIKVGYQHFDKNRVELYYKGNTLDTKEGEIKTESFGINYEWGFTSLGSETLMPYLSLGFGFGDATSKKLKAVDKSDIGEINFGIGAHYQVTEHFDVQVAYQNTGTIFDNYYDKETDDISAIGQNNVMVGFNYKF